MNLSSEQKLQRFLKELDTLSRKHGVWIDMSENDSIILIDQDYNILASELRNDEDTQEYICGAPY